MKGSIFGYLEDESGRKTPRLRRDMHQHEDWVEAILPAGSDADASLYEGDTNRRPLTIFAFVIGAIGLLLAGRLAMLQIVGGSHNLALADGNRTREKVDRAPRGLIYDRNMAVLAKNQASFDVTVVPQQLPKATTARQTLYAKVGSIIGLSAADIQAKAEVTCKQATPGCLDTPIPQLVAAGVERDKALMIDQASSSLPGFSLDVNPIRQYTDNNLLSVFLGYTSRVDADEVAADPSYGPTDLIGKLGIEKQYESILRGTNGGEETEVDATGKPVRVLASRASVPGNNLVLAVDQRLEQVMSDSLARQLSASGAQRGAAIAMDPRNGQILAAVSLPGYDNNLFSKGISQKDYQALVSNPGQPLFNKVVSGGYPSGSIIKPFGAAAALQEGIITTSTTVNDTGKLIIPNKYDPSKPSTYLGWERSTGLGVVNVISAITRSSDIFFYEVMGGFTDFTHYLGVTKLTDYYQKFGLGSRTGVDIPNESAGRVPTPAWKKAFSGESWFTGDTYNISVGQGDLLVSPLQMVAAVSAIANGGTLYTPHFVDRIIDATGKTVQQITPQIQRQGFISPQNLAIVRQGMLGATQNSNGTACCLIKAQVPVAVAAKTGTAETVVHDAGTPAKLQSQPDAWFEAFAPYDNPQIAIVVIVEHAGEGAEFAAPVARESLVWYFTQGPGTGH